MVPGGAAATREKKAERMRRLPVICIMSLMSSQAGAVFYTCNEYWEAVNDRLGR